MDDIFYDSKFWHGPPRFIAVEGPDGAGKSTLVTGLVTWMREELGLEVEQLLEPGSGRLASELRAILLMGEMDISTYEEIMLMTAARVDTRLRHVQPALTAGKWVICDRAELSTIVYQGFARDEGAMLFAKQQQDMIRAQVRRADLYLVLQLAYDKAQLRLLGTGKLPDRFESADVRFRQRVSLGFELIDNLVPGEYRMAHIDASVTPEELVQLAILAIQAECS